MKYTQSQYEKAILEGINLYLDLMELVLLGLITDDPPLDPWSGVVRNDKGEIVRFGQEAGVHTIEPGPFKPQLRLYGRDWPATAHTMIGKLRMQNIRELVRRVYIDGVPGDLVETGVWRGGASIYMRAILKAFDCTDRKIWCADSFEGLPVANREEDRNDLHTYYAPFLAVSLEKVKENFARYDLLDDQVVFLKGWFKDTLPTAPIEKISVLRLDGDMYESTMDALEALYPKVSEGGYVIVDDYGTVKGCKKAVDEYWTRHQIKVELIDIDGSGSYWRKP